MSPTATQVNTRTECLDCGGSIELSANPMVGEILACPECSAEFELRNTAPVELAAAPELEEDWGE